MILRSSPALLEALALLRSPRGARPGPDDCLPGGVELLIRLVGGDAQALELAATSTRETKATLIDAAAFYIQQVMFAPGSDSYRVLGLDPGATDEQLKSHHRWLTRWLHPDRNPDEWEAVYSERVNRAWQDLRNSDRRQRYDQARAGSAVASPVQPGKKNASGRPMHLDGAGPGLSLRWLPHAIFGGLGLSAVALVALYYALHFSSQSAEFNAPTEIDRDLDASALANPRDVRRDVQGRSPGLPQRLAANSLGEPGSEQSKPSPSVAVETTGPQTSAPAQYAIQPLARPSAAVTSEAAHLRQASVPSPGPVASRQETPRLEQVASFSSEAASQSDQRLPSAVAIPVAKADAREAPHAAPFSQREANRIVGRFSELYAEGDLVGMRDMFTADATSPDGGLDAILDEYDRLFRRSKHRQLSVHDVNWSASGNTFTIVARYEATLKTGLLMRTRSQGRLRMEMRQVEDQWRISRLEHNERAN